MATISIIIPVYNSSLYLKCCIDSVLRQSFDDFELILINDGSSDSSGEICDRYSLQDNRVKVLHQLNSGASVARNRGMKVATGTYLCFIDADDYVSCHYLKDLYNNMKSCDVDMVIQGLIRLDGDDEKPRPMAYEKTYSLCEGTPFFKEINIFKNCGPVSKLFKKDIIINNDLLFHNNLNFAEDFDFFINYLLHCKKVRTSKSLNYYYLYRPGSLSTRVYSYEQEYNGLCRLDSSFTKLQYRFKDSAITGVSEHLFCYYMERVLISNYMPPRQSRRIRLSRLNTIDKKFVCAYNKHYKPSTLFTRLSKFLFSQGYFKSFDLLNSVFVN